jgi:hypothetical protein
MTDFTLFAAVPSASADGTPIGTPPPNCFGVALYIPASGSVTYAIASAQPTGAPSPTWANANASTVGPWVEKLLPGQNLYVTALTGSVLFRWIMGG